MNHTLMYVLLTLMGLCVSAFWCFPKNRTLPAKLYLWGFAIPTVCAFAATVSRERRALFQSDLKMICASALLLAAMTSFSWYIRARKRERLAGTSGRLAVPNRT